MRAGKTDSATVVISRGLNLASKEFGTRDTAYAQVLLLAARIYDDGHNFDEVAERLMREALSIMETEFGGDDTLLVPLLRSLSFHILTHQRKPGEAERLMKRGLEINLRKLGSEHPNTAYMMRSLGGLYYTQGQLDESETWTRKALQIWEKVSPEDHARISHALTAIGHILTEKGEIVQSIPFYERAAEIRRSAFSRTDPRLAAYGIGNLANAYAEVGRFEDEDRMRNESEHLAANVQLLEIDKIDILSENAKWNLRRGHLAEAESLFQLTATIIERNNATESPYVGAALVELADVQIRQHKFFAAESLLLRAKRIWISSFDPDHYGMIDVLRALAECRSGLKHYLEAESLYVKALEISKRILGPIHPTTAKVMQSYSE
jgi:tetratricopeptide (TPR) repeat protein